MKREVKKTQRPGRHCCQSRFVETNSG